MRSSMTFCFLTSIFGKIHKLNELYKFTEELVSTLLRVRWMS